MSEVFRGWSHTGYSLKNLLQGDKNGSESQSTDLTAVVVVGVMVGIEVVGNGQTCSYFEGLLVIGNGGKERSQD